MKITIDISLDEAHAIMTSLLNERANQMFPPIGLDNLIGKIDAAIDLNKKHESYSGYIG